MLGLERVDVFYATDRRRRSVVGRRSDGLFQVTVECALRYTEEDEWNPLVEPFTASGEAPTDTLIDERLADGIFGTFSDAESEARRLVAM